MLSKFLNQIIKFFQKKEDLTINIIKIKTQKEELKVLKKEIKKESKSKYKIHNGYYDIDGLNATPIVLDGLKNKSEKDFML
jgi:hypothetical protein